MEHLLPVGWVDVATKAQTRPFFLGNVGMLLAAGGPAVGAARLL